MGVPCVDADGVVRRLVRLGLLLPPPPPADRDRCLPPPRPGAVTGPSGVLLLTEGDCVRDDVSGAVAGAAACLSEVDDRWDGVPVRRVERWWDNDCDADGDGAREAVVDRPALCAV